MGILIGIILAVVVSIFATTVGFDRERSFYPITLIIIAVLYGFFAILADSTRALLIESIPGAIFVATAVAGYMKKLWWVVAGLIGHGIFDLAHPHLISNPGVPIWWPGFCLAYDVTAGLCLAFLLKQSKIRIAHS